MGKLLSFCLLIVVGIFALAGHREYQKLENQLNQTPSSQFIAFPQQLIHQSKHDKDQSQRKKSNKQSSQKSSKKQFQQILSQKTNYDIQFWLSNSISITNHNLQQTLSSIVKYDKHFSIQQITFAQNNFSATGLVVYKLKQLFQKYILKNFIHFFQPTNLSQSSQIQIKIFDLRSWTNREEMKQAIDNTLDSLIYLKKSETDKLFWFQSKTGLLKSQKARTQQVKIYAYVLLDKSMKKSEFDLILQYIQDYAEIHGDLFEFMTPGFQASNQRKQSNKNPRKNSKNRQK